LFQKGNGVGRPIHDTKR